MQDIEFTVQDGKLCMLQTRTGKRTATAAAQDRRRPGARRADRRRTRPSCASIPTALDQLLHPHHRSRRRTSDVVATRPAGLARRRLRQDRVRPPTRPRRSKAQGREVILVRKETSPEDIDGMHAAAGILTTRGGMTSHAAVVARGMGKPCVCGAGSCASIDKAGDHHGRRRDVPQGRRHHHRRHHRRGHDRHGPTMRQPELSGDFATLMDWADKARTLRVRTNADTPADAAAGARVRRRRHRPVPHRAHVLRGRAASSPCAR